VSNRKESPIINEPNDTDSIFKPGKIVWTEEEAKDHNINGGVCAIIKNNNHLEIYINPLITFTVEHNETTDENKLIQQTKIDAVVEITDNYIKKLPTVIEADIELAKDSHRFYIFQFDENKIIIPQNRSNNEFGEPFLVTENSPRANLE